MKKPTNPKDALGIKKLSIHLLPMRVMAEASLAMLEGGRKYGAHNYRDAGVKYSVYVDAVYRHIFLQFWEGEDIDGPSGLHHISKAIASLVVLRDSMLMGNAVDDRPIRHPGGVGMDELSKQVEDILEKYPDCVPPFLESNRGTKEKTYKEIPIKDRYCGNCLLNSYPLGVEDCKSGGLRDNCFGTQDHPNWKPIKEKTDDN